MTYIANLPNFKTFQFMK